jgi:hypothetical protein
MVTGSTVGAPLKGTSFTGDRGASPSTANRSSYGSVDQAEVDIEAVTGQGQGQGQPERVYVNEEPLTQSPILAACAEASTRRSITGPHVVVFLTVVFMTLVVVAVTYNNSATMGGCDGLNCVFMTSGIATTTTVNPSNP